MTTEIIVAIIGAVATILVAVVPAFLQRSKPLNQLPPLPTLWPVRLCAAASAAFCGVGFIMVLFSGYNTYDALFSASLLSYIEFLVLASIASAILGHISRRRVQLTLATFGYANAIFILLLIAHILISPYYRGMLVLSAPASYSFVVFFVFASTVSALILALRPRTSSKSQTAQ